MMPKILRVMRSASRLSGGTSTRLLASMVVCLLVTGVAARELDRGDFAFELLEGSPSRGVLFLESRDFEAFPRFRATLDGGGVRAFSESQPVPTRRQQSRAAFDEGAIRSLVSEIVRLTNEQRTRHGLPPVAAAAKLHQVAHGHAENMARQLTMAHQLDGKGVGDRLTSAGFLWGRCAENVAAGYPNAQSVVDGWMSSEGHRQNILGDFSQIDVGVCRGADQRLYFAQVFASPVQIAIDKRASGDARREGLSVGERRGWQQEAPSRTWGVGEDARGHLTLGRSWHRRPCSFLPPQKNSHLPSRGAFRSLAGGDTHP